MYQRAYVSYSNITVLEELENQGFSDYPLAKYGDDWPGMNDD